ncbi:uncharacterized protein LOC143281382 [Babylonia areolata]|uniref:uncharacterized protein LOC143281382 n=1 Tax=Babylonia areolata TaxID=304850 RepID=UPI003FD45C69
MPGSADDTVADRLLRWARESGDKPAFIFRGAKPGNQRLVLTRAEVYDLSMVFCSKIQDAEIGAGQVVCNTLPNSPERLLVDLGCMMAGAATVHGMLHLADGDDLAKVLARAGCAALVVDPNHQPSVLGILGDRVIVRGDNARSRLVPNLQKVFNVDCGGGCETRPWLEALRQVRPIMPERTAANDIAIIFVLAGTSAFSRLVSKTQQQFILMGEAFNDLTGMGPTDIIYNDRSLGWYNGSCCDYVARGTTRVLVDMTAAPKDPLEFAWQCSWPDPRC